MTDQLVTIPAAFQMASTETLPFALDTTPLLVGLETPSAPVVTLTELATGVAYPTGLSGSPIVAGNVITQHVTALQAGWSYRLAFTFQAAVGKVWTEYVLLTCPF